MSSFAWQYLIKMNGPLHKSLESFWKGKETWKRNDSIYLLYHLMGIYWHGDRVPYILKKNNKKNDCRS